MALDSRVERRFSRTFRPPFLAHVNNKANKGTVLSKDSIWPFVPGGNDEKAF